MKALFWNIGKKLSDKKIGLISEAITSETPDIFCIAEGSFSKKNCQELIKVFKVHKYSCYYSPLFSEIEALKLKYNFNKYGLKIFVRSDTILKAAFTFSDQREGGRIVVLRVYEDFKQITFIFLHNKSKVSHRILDPLPFLFRIREMIEYGKVADDPAKIESMGDTNRVIIMGDFNLEPWDDALRHKKFLSTSFFKKHNTLKKREKDSNKHYFNPVVETIFNSDIENLVGTYYNDSGEWALFDFILYDTHDGAVSYDIITKFKDGSPLLNQDMKIKKSFLYDGLDHLPIVAEIEK